MSRATELMIEANQLMAQAHNAMVDALREQAENCGAWTGRIEAYRFDVDKSMERLSDQLEQGVKRAHAQAGPAEPGSTDNKADSLRQRAEAWDEVCRILDDVAPGWINSRANTGKELAIRAIRDLFEKTKRPSPVVKVALFGEEKPQLLAGDSLEVRTEQGFVILSVEVSR